MSTFKIQFRRGTTAQHETFTGAQGEITYDTERKTLVLHDGTTVGGHPVALMSELPTDLSQLTDTLEALPVQPLSTVPTASYGERALGAGYYSPSLGDDVSTIYYFNTSTATTTNTFGNLTSADRAQGTGLSNKTLGIFLGGRVWHTGTTANNSINYVNFATPGQATSYGTLSAVSNSNGAAGCGDGNIGLWLRGSYSVRSTPMQIDYLNIATSGNSAQWGTCPNRMPYSCTGSDTRGLFFGSSNIDYVTYASQSNSSTFGTTTIGGYGAGAFTDTVYAVYMAEGKTQMEYVSIDTTGNASTAGTLAFTTSNAQEYWSNDTGYGFYTRYFYWEEGMQKLAISTLGDASTFFEMTATGGTAWGASASGNAA